MNPGIYLHIGSIRALSYFICNFKLENRAGDSVEIAQSECSAAW